MYVSALRMGLTSVDLAEMPFGLVACLMAEWADMNAPRGKGGEQESSRAATQEDIKGILY